MYDEKSIEMRKRALECDDLFDRRSWIEKIPWLEFPDNVMVKVIPPIGGAMVRFMVCLRANPRCWVSVYLDCYSLLWMCDEPYWEIYPSFYERGRGIGSDVERFSIDDVGELLQEIANSLEIQYRQMLGDTDE